MSKWNIPALYAYPGYTGVHTQDQAPGALPNGSRVVKVMSDPGDTHPVGALATVLGSIKTPSELCLYFVEWDAHPHIAVGVAGPKIQAV